MTKLIQKWVSRGVILLLCFVLLPEYSEGQSISQLIERSKSETDIHELDKIYAQLINHYLRQDLDSMKLFASEFLDIANQHGDRRFIVAGHYNLGRYYAVKGDVVPAIEQFKMAYDLSEDVVDAIMKGRIVGMMGYVYYADEQLDAALEYYNQTITYFESIDAKGPLSVGLSTIGSIYYKKEDLAEAESFYRRSLVLKESLNDSLRMTTDIKNLAMIFRETGRIDSAIIYLNRALVIDTKMGGSSKLMGTYRDLARLHIQLDEGETALEYANNTVELAKDFNSFQNLERAYQVLYEVYEYIGMPVEALENYILYKSYSDSIHNEASRVALIEAREKFNAEKREQEIELLAAKNGLQRTRIILISVLLGAGFLISLLIILRLVVIKQKEYELREKDRELLDSQKKLAEEELKNERMRFEHVQKELTDYALHIVEKNDFLEKLKEQIFGIKFGSDRDEIRRELTKVEMKILQNVSLNDEREVLEAKVNDICSGFFKNLGAQFPELTEKDKRLAALIRLKLSSKDMAGILNIEPKSVEQRRYRLRKKLNLGPREDLAKFFLSL